MKDYLENTKCCWIKKLPAWEKSAPNPPGNAVLTKHTPSGPRQEESCPRTHPRLSCTPYFLSSFSSQTQVPLCGSCGNPDIQDTVIWELLFAFLKEII